MSRRARTTGASTVSNILNAKNCMEFLSSHLACVYILFSIYYYINPFSYLFIFHILSLLFGISIQLVPQKLGASCILIPSRLPIRQSIEFIFSLVYYFQVKANQLLNRLFTKLTGRALLVLEFRVGFGSQVQLEGSQSQLEHSFAAPSTPAPSAGAPQPPHLRLIFRLILISWALAFSPFQCFGWYFYLRRMQSASLSLRDRSLKLVDFDVDAIP